jgi:hypothetical protein
MSRGLILALENPSGEIFAQFTFGSQRKTNLEIKDDTMRDTDNGLTSEEQMLYEMAARGEWVRYSPSTGAALCESRGVLRADRLQALMTAEVQGVQVHWRGVRVRGARITGSLDLRTANVLYPVEFVDCFFDEPVNLVEASMGSITLTGSHVAALHADRAHIRGSLNLSQGFTSEGVVSLFNAKIDGDFNCDGGNLLGVPRSLYGSGLSVAGDLTFGVAGTEDDASAFTAAGEVRLVSATVGGDFFCGGASFGGQPASLNAGRINVAGSVFMRVTEVAGQVYRFETAGGVVLRGARVGGSIDCRGGYCRSTSQASLSASSMDVGGTLFLGVIDLGGVGHPFAATGGVRLIDATVGGDVDCDGGQFGGKPGTTSLSLDGAKIGGAAKLGVAAIAGEVHSFRACGPVSLVQASVTGDVDCDGGQFGGSPETTSLDASRAQVGGALFMGVADVDGHAYPFNAAGGVDVVDARVAADVDCDGGQFGGIPETTSLSLDGAKIGGAAKLGVITVNGEVHSFRACGPVSLVQASVTDDVDCDGGQFGGKPETTSLNLDRAEIGGAAKLGVITVNGEVHSFRAYGPVSLIQASVTSALDCDGGQFGGTPESMSVNASKARVGGTLYMGVATASDQAHPFTAPNEVRIRGATIGGDLDCRGGHFLGVTGASLSADRITVAGTIRLGVTTAAGQPHDFIAESTVSLIQARTQEELDCRGADLRGTPSSLKADGMTVGRSVRLGLVEAAGQVRQFRAKGEVQMVGMTVGADLDCNGGEFGGLPRALNCESVAIQRSFLLGAPEAREGYPFVSSGGVRLAGGTVGGDLNCDGGDFSGSSAALNAEDLRVSGTMHLRTKGRARELNLRHANTGQLLDTESSWPLPGQLEIDGFVYGGFAEPAPQAVQGRLKWLALQPGNPAQPYGHLATIYRNLGDEKSATKVSVEREWRRIRHDRLGPSRALAKLILGVTIGFGYRPGRAIFFLIALYLLGALWIYPHARTVMIETKPPTAGTIVNANGSCPINYPCYSPWAYSFDTLIPIIHLGQSDAWTPAGDDGSAVRYYGYVVTILGWGLASMAIAGFSGLVRKT